MIMAKGTQAIHVIQHWEKIGLLIIIERLLNTLPNQILNRKVIITKQSYLLRKISPLMSTKKILQILRP